MNLNLSGRRAIVCGSSQGIGRAIAIELASLGADITLMARNPERLESVARELAKDSGQKHEMIVADFSEPAQVKIGIDQFVGSKKTAEILINNTGGPPGGTAIDADINEYLEAFNNHLVCNQILTQALAPGMKSKKFGRIVNVISTSVKQPIPGLGVSNTIRGAVANWAKTLSVELGPYGITVNNVLPGFTRTARLDQIIQSKADKTGQSVEIVSAAYAETTPAKRFADAHEIAAAAAFLCSPAAAYINGVNLPVDGGRTLSL
ncbi:MAG: SDR family oxidoreductase [Planctomycetota bacterium]